MNNPNIKIQPLPKEDEQWILDFIKNNLHFMPSINIQSSFLPFRLQRPFAIYDISNWSDDNFANSCDLIAKALCNCLPNGHKLYSIDWEHNFVLYDPRHPECAYSNCNSHPLFTESGILYFNDFYPDGDYYFFIEKYGSFGYLAHPWREEVWIFGEELLQEVSKIAPILNWKLKATVK